LAKTPDDTFTDLLTRLVRVPKEAIDKKEREYQKAKKRQPAKPGQIVPTTKRKAG
jgi:hypothetical protein